MGKYKKDVKRPLINIVLSIYRNMWNKLGQTEVIMDTMNPKWVKSFDVQYHFEKREYYKAVVYDVEDFNNPNNFDAHDLAGEVEFALHEVVTARD